jgi:hypothetical protein
LYGEILFGFVVVGLAWTGAYTVTDPQAVAPDNRPQASFALGILPVTLTGAAWLLLSHPLGGEVRLLVSLVSGALLTVLLLAQYWTTTPAIAKSSRAAQLFLRLLAYLIAIVAYVAIHLRVVDSRLSVLVTIALSMAISLHVVEGHGPLIPPKVAGPDALTRLLQQMAKYWWLRAALLVVLLVIGSWLLDQWVPSLLLRSLVWTVVIYVAAGLTNHFFAGKLTRRVALEYAIVGLSSVLLILPYAR